MRLIFFIGLCVVGFVFSPWVLLPIALLYAFRYTAYELVFLGMMLDVSFGVATFGLPFPFIYTVLALFLVCTMERMKPYLRGIQRRNE